ncbi:MAG: SMI1/KNR4 family protein [Pirellula sp.]|jgi:hypothetical protein|nr:SMI1/KNR4 family protein [Pirellula sp.]
MIALEHVVAILPELEKPPGESIPSGLGQADVDGVESRIGFSLPGSFRTWLKTTNGPCVGPGGIVGVDTARELQNLESIYELYPKWKAKRWVPVAGDGCGNYYVLVHVEYDSEPVVFVDIIENPDEPAFIVASDLWHFLDFLFRKDMGKSRWPFDKAEVVERDPKILKTELMLPWNA